VRPLRQGVGAAAAGQVEAGTQGLAGSRGGAPAELKGRYLAGLLLAAVAFIASGLAPAYGIAVFTFALGGIGNGLVLVHERLLLQAIVPDGLMGRVFGVRDTVQCWAFAPGFVCAGALAALLGPRGLLVAAGAGALIVCAAVVLHGTWADEGRQATRAPLRPALAES
jgi:MFS family permease